MHEAVGAAVGVEARGDRLGATAHAALQHPQQYNQRLTRGVDGGCVEIGV